MSPARCDDPNCPCRSDELQWFSDPVLRRDAAKTDYIVIPLLAGVMARSIVADQTRKGDDPGDAALLRLASPVIALAERGRTESWEHDQHAYGVVANLLFCEWPALMTWGSVSYERTTVGVPLDVTADVHTAAVARFLGAHPAPSLTESAIVATIVATHADANGKSAMPLLGKAGRRLRVLLADRLRRDGLVTWPLVLAAAVDDWNLSTLERLAHHHAEAGDAGIRYAMMLADRWQETAAAEARDQRSRPDHDHAPNLAPLANQDEKPGESEAAEQLVEDAVAEIEYWRGQRDTVQRERDTFAQRDARSRSRVESLERQLAGERVRRRELEAELAALHAERERATERTAVEEALVDDAPLPAADSFAGRRVLFFTGVESAETRAVVAQRFWEFGASQVDTYWTDRSRGPDTFPSDAIIAMDVSLMAHSAWNGIMDKVRSAGAWCYWGKHGATTMARATAAAWGARAKP